MTPATLLSWSRVALIGVHPVTYLHAVVAAQTWWGWLARPWRPLDNRCDLPANPTDRVTLKPSIPPGLRALLVLESIALAIALVAPVTPSKTGSYWSPAELFVASPSYPEKVLASFVLVNLMMAFLGLVVWVVSRVSASD